MTTPNDGSVTRPGDLLLTRSEGRGGSLIRLGAALQNKPNLANHVAVVHHVDAAGTMWVIEGRPGGVGWRQADDYLRAKYTMGNPKQPKTEQQRKDICAGAVGMLGTDYDWGAIAQDTAEAFGLDHVWELKWGKDGEVPGQVVCSSMAAWLYKSVGLDHPPGDREVAPADWTALWIDKGWASHPTKATP